MQDGDHYRDRYSFSEVLGAGTRLMLLWLSQARQRNLLGPLYSWLIVTHTYSPGELLQHGALLQGDRAGLLSVHANSHTGISNLVMIQSYFLILVNEGYGICSGRKH